MRPMAVSSTASIPYLKTFSDEGAEAVAEDGGVARQVERVHDAGDVVGVVGDGVEDDRRGGAEAGEVDARDAAGELREHEVEDRHLRQQRVQKQERRAGAALVVFDLGGADGNERHYCSRFLAGGKSRE